MLKSFYRILIFSMGLLPCSNMAFAASRDECLLELIDRPGNETLTVLDLKATCQIESPLIEVEPVPSSASRSNTRLSAPTPVSFSRFFEPYKKSNLLFGSMKNDDNSTPFSGKTFDIKFELGLKFNFLPDRPMFEAFAPLSFGYSQKSWWDISESSAPFKEHNYNPEVYWDYARTSQKNGLNFLGRYLDRIGIEHQSNGLDENLSRSWDRVYAARDFIISDRFTLGLKAWDVINQSEFNSDISDYLGSVNLNASYKANDRLTVNLETMKGNKVDTYSYQLDLVYRIPEWINSEFILSYYDGYGEALISYNKKTSSLRAGFNFPIVREQR